MGGGGRREIQEGVDIYAYMADSLCCTAEMNTTNTIKQLYTNKIIFQLKKKKNNDLIMGTHGSHFPSQPFLPPLQPCPTPEPSWPSGSLLSLGSEIDLPIQLLHPIC